MNSQLGLTLVILTTHADQFGLVPNQRYHEASNLSMITTDRISELTSKTTISCARACYNNNICALFNINSSDGRCILFSTSFLSVYSTGPVGGRLYWRMSDNCPLAEGYIAFDNPTACYRLSRAKKTWIDAEADCEGDGGHLVVLEDLDKRQQVMDATADFRNTECVYVGLKQKAHLLPTVTRVWVDGRDFINTFWVGGQPDYGERCAGLCQQGLYSLQCDSSSYYMCQIDITP